MPKRCYHSIFLSDVHLGARGCEAERLIDILQAHRSSQAHRCLQAHPCETLYLVGDIVERWRLKSSFYWLQSHNNVLRRFFTLMKRVSRVRA